MPIRAVKLAGYKFSPFSLTLYDLPLQTTCLSLVPILSLSPLLLVFVAVLCFCAMEPGIWRFDLGHQREEKGENQKRIGLSPLLSSHTFIVARQLSHTRTDHTQRT